MSIIEDQVARAMYDATTSVAASPSLPMRAQRGGTRRRRRQRVVTTVAMTALIAGSVPAAITLTRVGVQPHVARIPPSGRDLYANPPTSADPCLQAGPTGQSEADPAAYPQLLMLPQDQSVNYAFANTGGAPQCEYFPHIALTLLDRAAGIVTRSVEIDGPNALSPQQAGVPGLGSGSQWNAGEGQPGDPTEHLTFQLHGRSALMVYTTPTKSADVYWSGADGSRWHAKSSGPSVAAIEGLLRATTYDAHTGTAQPSAAASRGWSVAAAAPDASGNLSGVFYALWHQDGAKVALDVVPGPDRVNQLARRNSRLVTVGGGPADVYTLGHRHRFAIMHWQPSRVSQRS